MEDAQSVTSCGCSDALQPVAGPLDYFRWEFIRLFGRRSSLLIRGEVIIADVRKNSSYWRDWPITADVKKAPFGSHAEYRMKAVKVQ